jgi:hypothetical protein
MILYIPFDYLKFFIVKTNVIASLMDSKKHLHIVSKSF